MVVCWMLSKPRARRYTVFRVEFTMPDTSGTRRFVRPSWVSKTKIPVLAKELNLVDA